MGHANIVMNLVGINIKFTEKRVYFLCVNFKDKYLEEDMTFGSVLFNNFTTVQRDMNKLVCGRRKP